MQHHGLRMVQKTEQVLALQGLTVISIVLVDMHTRITEEINLPIGHVPIVVLDNGQSLDRIPLVSNVPISQTILKLIIPVEEIIIIVVGIVGMVTQE